MVLRRLNALMWTIQYDSDSKMDVVLVLDAAEVHPVEGSIHHHSILVVMEWHFRFLAMTAAVVVVQSYFPPIPLPALQFPFSPSSTHDSSFSFHDYLYSRSYQSLSFLVIYFFS